MSEQWIPSKGAICWCGQPSTMFCVETRIKDDRGQVMLLDGHRRDETTKQYKLEDCRLVDFDDIPDKFTFRSNGKSFEVDRVQPITSDHVQLRFKGSTTAVLVSPCPVIRGATALATMFDGILIPQKDEAA